MRLGKYGKLMHFDRTSIGVGDIARFTIFEWKPIGGIIINVFNTTDQNRFHTHAFPAVSLMLRGTYEEDVMDLETPGHPVHTKHTSLGFRFIPRQYCHKIRKSSKNAVSITFEGPWKAIWAEYFDNGRVKEYTWGREVIYDSERAKRP